MQNPIESNSPESRSHAAALAATDAASVGAPPSITAPANCIRPLRHGVDSLYVSYKGAIHKDIALRLEELKSFSQSTTDQTVAQGVYKIRDHRFTVLPRGKGRFAFVLEDNWFHIQVSNACASALPLAHVQIRSEYLTAVGAMEALKSLDAIVLFLGDVQGPATISRLDLFVDFVGDHNLTSQPGFAWVKRCRKRDIHEDRDRITGISFGAGNEISARLYDKTVELLKSRKDYLKPLWAAKGWEEGETVWRMEFQARREALPDELKVPAVRALEHEAAWWRYLCSEWLRLTIPSQGDETRSRWPTHPVWQELASVWDVAEDAPLLTRVSKERAPNDDVLFKAGFWGLSSFMAREGISDLGEGLGEYLHALKMYHEESPLCEGMTRYIDRKVQLKARRYNTRVRRHDEE